MILIFYFLFIFKKFQDNDQEGEKYVYIFKNNCVIIFNLRSKNKIICYSDYYEWFKYF